MPDWLELLLLAIASIFWPTLILVVVLALRLAEPIKILLAFLVGGLLTTVSIGIAFVFALQESTFLSGSRPPANPALNITAGLLSLLAAVVLVRKRPEEPAAAEPPSGVQKPSLAERAVGGGAVVAFVAGVVLNIVPGTFPIVALKDIAQLDASNGVKVASVIVFYLIMFAFIEVPIVAFLFAPERTTVAVNASNAWIGRNARRVVAYVLGVVGIYLTARGVVQLLR